jgi:hypothetical protein
MSLEMKHKVNPKMVPKGFAAITWFPWLAFYASAEVMTERCVRHESIHGRQQAEMLIVFFYLWYGIEWFIKVFKYGLNGAYRNISFEREAYRNDSDFEYLKRRKLFAWIKFV